MFVEMCLSLEDFSSFFGGVELRVVIRNSVKILVIVRFLFVVIFGGSLFCVFLGEWS